MSPESSAAGQRRLGRLGLALAAAAVAALAIGARIEAVRLPEEIRPAFRTPAGEPLFYTADGFYHLRLAREIAETGRRGTRDQAGQRWDDLSFAPAGRPVVPSLLQPIEAWAWRLWPGGASMAAVAYYLPAIGSALLAVAALWIGRRLAGIGAGLAAGLLAALHPELISHTHAGMADTPWLSLVLYAVAAGAGLELAGALLGGTGGRRVLLWTAALAASLGLFALAWIGWTAAAATAAVPVGAAMLARLWRQERSAVRRFAIVLGAAVAAAAAAMLLLGSGAWRKLVRYAEPGTLGAFPDGTSQVQELLGIAPARLLAQLGGWWVVVPAVAGVLWLALGAPGAVRRPAGRPAVARLGALLLAAWALPALFAGWTAMRFLAFAMPPLAIAAGCGLAALGAAAAALPGLRRRPAWSAAVVAVLLVAALAWSFRTRFESFAHRRPAADLALAEAAAAIAERSPEDALVFSWWDHGYALSALSGRAAAIDGGSYQGRRLYWMALALSTRDETLAVNLLRVIGCGGDRRLYRALRAGGVPADRSVALIRLALRHDDPMETARTLVGHGAGQPAVAEAFRLLECTPPPSWLVVGGDLSAKTTSWAYFGSWRFDGANPPPRPGMSTPVQCSLAGSRLECANGYSADLARDGFADRSTPGHFAAIGPPRGDGLVPILHQHGPALMLTFVRRELADSLYVRLWYFDGLGLERFQAAGTFHHPPHTDRVLLFSIDWSAGEPSP